MSLQEEWAEARYIDRRMEQLAAERAAERAKNPPADPSVNYPRSPLERVYVVQAGEHVKVGVALNVNSRMRQLRAANPLIDEAAFVTIRLSDPYRVENAAHRLLRPWAVRREWFICTPAIAIEAVCSVMAP